jgi:hypothetical protein
MQSCNSQKSSKISGFSPKKIIAEKTVTERRIYMLELVAAIRQ